MILFMAWDEINRCGYSIKLILHTHTLSLSLMTLPINAHLKLVHNQETQWVEVSEDLWNLVSANQGKLNCSNLLKLIII